MTHTFLLRIEIADKDEAAVTTALSAFVRGLKETLGSSPALVAVEVGPLTLLPATPTLPLVWDKVNEIISRLNSICHG